LKRFWYSEAIRNSRLAFPPTRPLFFFGLLLVLFEYFFWTTERDSSSTDGPAIVLLKFGAALYGVYRVAAFHPNLRPAYREWLRTTAWRSPQPLPLGAVTLTLTDALILLIAAALVWYRHPGRSPYALILTFSAAYLLCMALALFTSGPRGAGYLVIFGLGGMVMSVPTTEITCAVALATYFVAWCGLHLALKSLRRIETISIERHFVRPSGVRSAEISSLNVGWPFGYLAPDRTVPRLAVFDAVCISALLSWLLASFMTLSRYMNESRLGDEARIVAFGFIFGGTALLIGRMILYFQNHRPPISLLGRLLTLRWIIPSYDYAFAAPLAGMIVLWVFAWPLLQQRHLSIVGFSALLTTGLLVGLVPGPSFRNWMLTSACRIVAQKPPQQAQR
jgi:hypothetical protein